MLEERGAVSYNLDPTIIAQLVRLHPKGWHKHISLMWELYGYKYGKAYIKNYRKTSKDSIIQKIISFLADRKLRGN